MLTQALIAVGAALASALLFLLAAQGSMAGGLVAYLTPLPIMIAALGWGHRLGLVATAVASAFFLSSLSIFYVATYVLAFGLPGWGLAYLALLARSDRAAECGLPAGDEAREHWFPLGHLVLWAGAAASAVVAVSLLAKGLDADGLDEQSRAIAARVAALVHGAVDAGGSPSGRNVAALAAILSRVLPVVTAASLMLLYLVNLWLAARTAQLSGRLVRPWPKLPENIRLPLWAGGVFLGALALTLLLPAALKAYAAVVATAIGLGFVLQALALAHAISRPMRARAAILSAVYVAVLLFVPFSLVALVAIGLADVVRPLARRLPGATARDGRDPPAT